MEGFRRISSERLSDKVVQQLLQRIRAGELPVGTRLPNEEELAAQMGVSRGILREALTTLQAQGYISRAPREGTIVQSLSGNESNNSFLALMRSAKHSDLIQLREAVECFVLRSVIRLASEEEINSLFQLLDAPLSTTEHRPDYFFHYRLAEISGNPLFCAFIDLYYDTVRKKAFSLTKNQRTLNTLKKEHVRIAEAIRARDAKTAVAAMRSHLNKVRRHTISGD